MKLPFPYIFISLTIVFTLLTVLRPAIKHLRSGLQAVLFLSGSILSFVFLFWAGAWLYISIYMKWLFLPVYLISLYSFFRRFKGLRVWPGTTWHFLRLVPRLIFILAMVFLLWLLVSGYSYDRSKAVNLDFPLHGKRYYVMQGGGSDLTNLFHRSADRRFGVHSYRYATDVTELNKWGNRANGMAPEKLTDYAIYGDSVFSPAAGKVVMVIDTVHQNRPGIYNFRPPHGNHVIIRSKGYCVFMAHFIPGSIMVKTGQQVYTGQPIGRVGNSGFTAEPHLHINVLRDFDTSDVYSGISVPALFWGKFFSLHDRFSKD